MRRRSFVSAGLAALAAPAFPSLAFGESTGLRNAGTAADPIRLSSNENPLGMPQSARRAVLDALDIGNRYPRYEEELIAAVAAKHGVKPENVILGNGSAEVLQMATQAVVAKRGRVVAANPTFEQVETYSVPFGVRLEKIAVRAGDAAHDLDRMRATADDAKSPVLVFLCNPNNPTGTLTSCDAIESWLREAPEQTLFLVDEAYFDFVDDRSYRTFMPLAVRQPNVLVSRTFSKVYGLAGLRIGYGIAEVETAKRIKAYSADGNINQLAIAAARACITDQAYIDRSLRVNREGRALLQRTLDELGIEHLPSHTNFLMHRIKGDLTTYNDRMLEAGVRVGRAFPPMLDWSRVSIGTAEEMALFVGRLREFRRNGWV